MFLADRAPITEINPISNVMQMLDEYARTFRKKKFIFSEIPQFVAKSSVKDAIDASYSIFLNKKSA